MMTKQKKTILINVSLLLLVIMSGGVAVYHKGRLHSLFSNESEPSATSQNLENIDAKITQLNTDDSTITTHNTVSSPKEEKSDEVKPDKDSATTMTFKDADINRMPTSSHPFAREAKKILAGGLEADDSISRRKILNYCEHFRTAYTTKDIDFIRQVLSDDALIIVGHTVKTQKDNTAIGESSAVRYHIRSKHEYLKNLTAVFAANKKITVDFSDFKIMRHPTMEGIYGVTLRQKYSSDLYSDEGFIFLLWDFRNQSMPKIHVRTWQPSKDVNDEDDIIGISDFNLQ